MSAQLLRSFAAGELVPELYGRIDLARFQTGLALCKNFWVLPHGAVQNAPGFQYIIETKDSTKKSILVPFSFNNQQTYMLEFGNQYIRFHSNGATVLEAAKAITGITQANPGVVTIAAHGFSNGQWVYLTGIGGMTQLNGRFVKVAGVTADTFQIQGLDGVGINTTGYGAYTAGGTAARVYEIASPYLEADLYTLEFTQKEDVLTVTHNNYDPRTLNRLGATNWTLTTVSFVPTSQAPTSPGDILGVTATGAGTKWHEYVVTATEPDKDESYPSSQPADLSTLKNITGWTQANPGVFTYSAAHGLAVGDPVHVPPGTFPATVPRNTYWVDTVPSATTVTLKNANDTPLDTTGIPSASILVYTAGVKNDLTVAGNSNKVSWSSGVSGTVYSVYKRRNGLYGYIGQTQGLQFVDDNIAPDMSKQPPVASLPFTSNAPAACAYHQFRKVFAGTPAQKSTTWLTASNTENNLRYSVPTQDDDAISFPARANDAQQIIHAMSAGALLLFATGGVWVVSPLSSDVLMPGNAVPRMVTSDGAGAARPILAGNNALYVDLSGSRIRELKPVADQTGAIAFSPAEISLFAQHLFDGYTIQSAAWAKLPNKMAWFVRNDGVMLGLTYLPEHEVLGWFQRATDGSFEWVASVLEGSESAVYTIVKRTVNGRTVRYVERQHSRRYATVADAFFVDSGLTYSGAATTTIGGLHHLEGKTVSILADGGAAAQKVVANGSITLSVAASKVQVGLQIVAQLKTLPLALEAQAFGRLLRKNVKKLALHVINTLGLLVGPAFTKLRPMPQSFTTPPVPLNEPVVMGIDGNWNANGQLCVQQSDPLPVTILGIAPDASTSDD